MYMNFITLDNNKVEGFFLVKSAERRQSARKQPYLDLLLADITGEIPAKCWEYRPEFDAFRPGCVVKVRGQLETWNERQQLRVEQIRLAGSGDRLDMSKIIPTAPFDTEWMLEEILRIVESFEDEDLKRLTAYLLNKNREKLLYWPAAVKMHHASRGGLLYHTLSICRLAQAVSRIYPFVRSDLLFCGVILHDIAKIQEFVVNEAGSATEYSVEGNLIGHLVAGAMEIHDACNVLGIPNETAVLVEHMVLSHHGIPEFGSPVRPSFVEAEILSQLDDLDAKVNIFLGAMEGLEAGAFSGRQWGLDNRKIYKHSESEADYSADLEAE